MSLLVVGAGPVGLALALALTHRGIPHRLVEKAPVASAWSRALAVQARTLETLAPLGMAAPILAAGLRPRGVTFHLGAGTGGFDLSHALHPGFPSVVILPQQETERLLAERLAALGGGPVERGTELVALDAATGAAVLRRADGREERATFERIVGCDGAHSLVRKAAGIAFEGAAYEGQFVLADGEATGLALERIHLFPGRNAGAFFFPLPGGQFRVVAMLPLGSPTVPQGDLSHFQLPGVTFGKATWWSAFRVSHRLVPGFRKGRVLLAGDAAHIHSPAGGQGMNLGIQDACSLAHALPGGEAALDAWAAQRRATAAIVVRRTDLLTNLIMGRTPGVRLLRGVALRLVPHLPPARRRFEQALAGLDYPAIS